MVSAPLDIVILAAGKGTRMHSDKPKVLHTLGGQPLLAHVIGSARALGSERILVIVGHGADQVEAQLAADDIEFVEQREQLGTGHAVQQALPHFRDDTKVLILYGDVPLTRPETLSQLVGTVSEQSIGLLTVELSEPGAYGRILRDEAGHVQAIVEYKDATEAQRQIREVNTGILAATAKQLRRWLPKLHNDNAQGEYYLTDIIAMAREEALSIQVAQPEEAQEVEGINNRQQQAALERYYQQRQARELMAQGVTLLDPARFDCRGQLSVERDVVIDVNCVFEGRVHLEEGVQLGPNCYLKDATLGAGTRVSANCVIEGAQVAENCSIGPFARLRPGTQLAKDAKVGNFVEIKKAQIGAGSKVNHLSYIGDTHMGTGVNVGAGTITCNYDGVNKFLTDIGDGVFIGSNTALVAPVKLGRNSTIGAGSVITKDVEPEELAIARARQRNIQGWQRPKKGGS